MNRFRSVLLSLCAVVIGTSLFVAAPASAQGSAALSITPKKTYTIEAGKSVDDTLVITNQDRDQKLNLTLSVVDFTYTDNSGTPKLMLAENAPQTTWSLKPFLTIPKTVVVEPKSTKTVDMSIAIPRGHGAGSYYSAIMYSSGGSEGGNLGLSASGVTLAFVNVPGEVKENLTLQKLGAYKKASNTTGGEYAWIHTDKPERIAYTLKNDGNVTESPVGSITLKPLIGNDITIQNINSNSSLALIGQRRTFTTCIKQKGKNVDFEGSRAEAAACTTPDLWPGYYRIDMTAYYGQNGNRTRDLTGHAGFWYLPWWFIIVSIVVILFIAYHVWKIVRFIRTKKGKSSHRKNK